MVALFEYYAKLTVAHRCIYITKFFCKKGAGLLQANTSILTIIQRSATAVVLLFVLNKSKIFAKHLFHISAIALTFFSGPALACHSHPGQLYTLRADIVSALLQLTA